MDQIGLIKDFVAKNTIPAQSGSECVDGRYIESGRVARPGGDFGFVMALLAANKQKGLGLSPEECFEKVYDAVIASNGNFYMHTDTHAKHAHEEASIGCSHIALAMNPQTSSGYGDVAEETKTALLTALEMAAAKKLEIINLEGDHKEEGVIIVNSETRTIKHRDAKHMFFVYDKKRDDLFIKQNLLPQLYIPELTPKDFQDASQKQLQATLQNLALGLPIFEVTPGSNTSINYIGKVE